MRKLSLKDLQDAARLTKRASDARGMASTLDRLIPSEVHEIRITYMEGRELQHHHVNLVGMPGPELSVLKTFFENMSKALGLLEEQSLCQASTLASGR